MNNDYHQLKKAKGKTARAGVWIIIALIILFALVLLRFATSGSRNVNLFGGMPSKADAYQVAKELVEPSLKSTSASFSDTGFEFGKKSDSVYVIQSFADVTTDDGTQTRQNFRVILRFKGGITTNARNWELQDLNLQ